MTFPPGTRLGPYEVVSHLGSGGMGEVYKAMDPKLDRLVAVKVLPESWQGDSTFLARFEREAKVLASLHHPNIVGIFDFGEADGRTYAVMELLEGRTLRQAIQEGPLPLNQVADIGSQVAHGLAAAHATGVIHRDLKPENIFLLKGGLVKLLDFGLAKKVVASKPDGEDLAMHPTSTNAGVLMGTVGYMAPEQLEPDGKADARSDLFALGCVLYEMLTGERVFRSETSMGTLHAILTQEPDLERPEIPPSLRELLRHCLAKQPALRFQNSLDLAFTLQALARPAGFAPPSTPKMRNLTWKAAAILLVAGGLLAFGLRLWMRTPALPVFTPLSPQEGQVITARFTRGGHVIYDLRQGHESFRAFEASPDAAERLLPELEGLIPLKRFDTGGWLLLRGTRKLDQGHEWISGDLLRADAQGGRLVPLTDGVSAADANRDGTLIVAIRRVDGHDRLEAPLGQVRVDSEGWLASPRISPSGNWVAFVEHDSGSQGASLVALHLKDRTRVELSKGWKDLEGLAWSSSDEVWFTASNGGEPRALYAASLRGRVRPVLAAPESLTLEDISPGGQALICQEQGLRAILARSPSEDPGLIQAEQPSLLGLSKDGRWTTFASPLSRIYLRRFDGEMEALGTAVLAAPSPDGSQVALASPLGAGWKVTIWSRSGSREFPLPGFNTIRQLTWGSATSILMAGSEGAGGFRVWRMSMEGGPPQPVCPEGVSPETPFRVSPDGRWLLIQAGPLLTRFDLQKPEAVPQTIPGISPGERILGWGMDDDHVLVIGSRLPALTAIMSLADGSRQPAFPLAAYGHEGALVDQALSAAGGEGYAIGCQETRSRLFLVGGLR